MGGFQTGFEKGTPKLSTGGGSGFSTGFENPAPISMNKSPNPVQQLNQKVQGHGGGIGGIGGWLGSKLSLAGHDIAQIPGGTYHLVGAALPSAQDIEHPLRFNSKQAGQAWGEFLHHPVREVQDTAKGKYGKDNVAAAQQIEGFVRSPVQAVEHPLRDPFQSLLTIGAVAGAGAGTIARAGAAADAAQAADEAGLAGRVAAAGKAFAKRPLMPQRTLKIPQLLKDENGNLNIVHKPVHLVESHAPLARAAQELHDRILQRSLDKNLTAERPSLVTRYANSRVGRANDEVARIAANTRNVAVKKLASIKNFDEGIQKGHGQLALFLRSANVLPHEAADFWNEQAAAGVNPEQTLRLSQWANELHHSKVLHVGDNGQVTINAAKYPILGRADQLVKANQLTREHIIGGNNLMSPEGIKSRKALVAETMRSEAARNPVSGVREGQGYTNLSVSEKRMPQSPFARSASPHIPKPKPFGLSHEATGEGVRSGLIPDNTTRGVARSTAEALRFLGTKQHRESLWNFGSDVKRTKSGEVLVADPNILRTGKLPLKARQFLGLERSTLHTLPQGEETGVRAAIKARFEDAVPRLASKDVAKLEDSKGIGTEAPPGYRWVPKQMVRDIAEGGTPRSTATKAVNDINSAITAATVYFKLSHIPQRLATDATTSALSGALFNPSTLKAAMELRKQLTTQEYEELAASTGTHGYQALPAEGESKMAHLAREGTKIKGKTILPGSMFYAHRIDSPFRFLNLVHEARKAGMGDAAGMRSLIKAAKNPADATPEQLSVLKRANRVSMMYDGLGPTEKRIIARGLWFYPWTKASVRFAGHTIAEHPLASAFGANLGAQEAKRSTRALGGKVPYYEFGLTPVGNSEVSDFSRLSPFSTAGDVLQAPSHLEQVRSSLNPAFAAAIDALTGTNSYGQQESRGTAALGDLTAPTPEAQILSGYLAHKNHVDQSKKMFPKSNEWAGTRDPLLRALLGTFVPRKVNKAALAKATQKRRTISIPIP